MRQLLHTFGFHNIIEGYDIDKTRGYLAYRPATESDWDALDMEAMFLNYDFGAIRVTGFAEGIRFQGRAIHGLGTGRRLSHFTWVTFV